MSNIVPLEQTDPELGELLTEVVNINKNYAKGKRPIIVDGSNVSYKGHYISNDPCYCGSGKKFKKCCIE
jgi:uncharacterized protein YchJ